MRRHVCVVGVLLSVVVGCSKNIVIRRSPGASTGVMGPHESCLPGEGPCKPDGTFDSSRFNHSGTTYFAMPECRHGIDRILVENSDSDAPVVTAECAGPPQPRSGEVIPTTGTPSAVPVATTLAPTSGIPTTMPGGGTSP